MSSVELRNVSKRFSTVDALSDVSVTINDGEFFVLLGPTGAGKTTTLRIIAALEKQDSGAIFFDGEPVDHLEPAERDVAMVFQQYSLYPTMTVWDNLAFPLRSPMRKVPQAEIEKRIASVAETLRITHLLERKTARLSGGEMQRVAIGRAIVRQPRIFLMDEPLSNLDAKLREALRVELQHLQKTQGDTTLLVTHDQIEALTMADRIAVLDQGRIIQVGAPADIYDKPATTFVATLVGTPRINLLPVNRQDGNLYIENSELNIPTPGATPLPDQMLLGIRPEDVRVGDGGPYAGMISLTEPLGVETIVHIQSGKQTLLSLMSGITSVKVGDLVQFSVFQERLHLFGMDGKRLA